MPRIRRTPPRILAPLLAALSIAILSAPLASVARAAQNSPAQKGPLDAPARDLARRIAASLPGGTRAEIVVHNQSSLSEDDATTLRATIADELTARGLLASGQGQGAASITITLSENTQGCVWVAQIQHGDDSVVLLQSVPRLTALAASPESEKILLSKELLWSGQARVIDAAEMPAGVGVAVPLFLLELEGIAAVVTDSQNTFRAEIPLTVSNPREPNVGIVKLRGDGMEVLLKDSPYSGEDCRTTVGADATTHCEVVMLAVANIAVPPMPFGDEEADISLACGGGKIRLGAGKGDFTQPDTVRAYASSGSASPLSASLAFAGPVMRLREEPDGTVIAIARNPQNGDYEIYRITAACGQ